MKTVLSGIRSTGHLHLGNYFGALRNFVQLQHQAKCYFFIADLHSLTTHPKPVDFHSGVKTILCEYLASGLDPEKSTLFVQSSIPQVSELYVLLNMLTYKGELERTPSFKDKVRLNPDNVNAGLLTYPVLMAADILVHRAHWVPVGKDQEQHLEITRLLARRFNKLYEVQVFPEPEAYNFGGNLIKIPGLDGSGKMGKSEENGIYLVDDRKTITKKVMRAVTDTGPTIPGSPMSPGVANLFTILEVVSGPEVVRYFREQYDNCTIRYGDLKKQLAEDICRHTLPIKARIEEIYNNGPYLKYVIEKGTEEACTSANATMALVRDAVGFKTF
ncbi:MAG TPA: tryptophan--tRNA ligase [Bacteroidales bacterium]|nr:tryptophan--tRNA ligase [Bacteroidales bacterium]HQN82518.1 tryptophan--tRNA ligase [Bacteroidales bacterium]HQP64831.1 tryptophan--tRNA ligase [Bacteroidales bacterium]